MKYEDILAWRQDVYEQTVLAAQMTAGKVLQSEELATARTPAPVPERQWTGLNGQAPASPAMPPKHTGKFLASTVHATPVLDH